MTAQGRRVVIAGAGSAGMTLAWRLSQDRAVDVVLVEAGGDPGPEVPDSLRREIDLAEQFYWPYTEVNTGAFLPRGRVLGGSSAVNYAGATRGPAAGYDAWAVPGWAWQDCLPAFRAIEADADFGNRPYHGADGPVPVVRRPLGDVDEPVRRAIDGLGHETIGDHNAPDAVGFGPFPANRMGADRASTLLTMLPDLRGRANVTLRPDCEVVEVVVSGGRAEALRVRTPTGDETIPGDVVVLSAGVYGTPEILFRSGVGPADELRAAGRPVLADAPELGRNVREHPMLLLDVEARFPLPPVDPCLLSVELGENQLGQVFPFAGLVPGSPESVISLVAALLSPTSTGHLEFTEGRARVHLRHFDTAEDRAQAGRLVARAADLLDALARAGEVSLPDQPWWRGDPGAALSSNVIGYNHPCGTCRMGADAGSVVDPDLRVRGVDDLLVADASVFPDITRSQTNLPAMMVGYRAAEFLGR